MGPQVSIQCAVAMVAGVSLSSPGLGFRRGRGRGMGDGSESWNQGSPIRECLALFRTGVCRVSFSLEFGENETGIPEARRSLGLA